MNDIDKLRIISFILYTIGVILLLIFDWRIFIGLFFVNWGQNLFNKTNDPKFIAEIITDGLQKILQKNK